MTISTNKVKMALADGNDSDTEFTFDFVIFAASELLVYLVDETTGVETLQTITTHYTVSTGPWLTGGTVTFVTAPTSDEQVLIKRSLPLTQLIDYIRGSEFPEEDHETALDRLVMIAQQIQEQLDRAILLSVASTLSGITLPAPVANNFISWNAAADGLTVVASPGTWIIAAGAPSDGTGNNGDMYINSSNGDLYGPKASGAWGSAVDNLTGPTGATGAAGADGSDGADGVFTGGESNVTPELTDRVAILDDSDSDNPKFTLLSAIQTLLNIPTPAFENNLLLVEHHQPSGSSAGTFTSGARRTKQLNTEVTNEITGGGLVYSLDYDAQSANFTVGQTLTGGTSGATATIVADNDGGTTGTLKLINPTGTFQDNETITDEGSGSATSDNASPDDTGTGLDYAHQVYLPAGTYYAEGESMGVDVFKHIGYLYDETGAADLLDGISAGNNDGTGYDVDTSAVHGRFTLSTASFIELEGECQTTSTSTNGLGWGSGFGGDEIYDRLMIWRLS